MNARILFLTPLFAPAVGGAAEHYGGLCSGLESFSSVERLIVLTEAIPRFPRQEDSGKRTVLRWLPPWLSIPRGTLQQRVQRRLKTQWALRRLVPKILKDEHINVVQIHSTAAYATKSFIGQLAKRGVPTIGDLRGTIFNASRFRYCDRVVCCSENTLFHAKTSGIPESILHLIPVGFALPPDVMSDPAANSAEGRQPYICYVGDISARKGIYELLDGFARFSNNHAEFQLILAGPNHEGARFTNQLTRGAVNYQGPVSHTKALSLIAGASLVVIPSKSEGMPRVALEAVALHKKVILPPGIPEIKRHCPDFVLPEITPEAIAAKMEEVIVDVGRPSFPLDEHHPQKTTAQYFSIYADLLGEGEGTVVDR